jgi:hypothetical protein
MVVLVSTTAACDIAMRLLCEAYTLVRHHDWQPRTGAAATKARMCHSKTSVCTWSHCARRLTCSTSALLARSYKAHLLLLFIHAINQLLKTRERVVHGILRQRWKGGGDN